MKKCAECKKEFKGYKTRKYCSRACYVENWKRRVPGWNKGKWYKDNCKECKKEFVNGKQGVVKKFCSKTCANRYNAKNGEDHHNWKGESAGYSTIHTWLRQEHGKAVKCENPYCDYKDPKRFEWASVSRKWLRKRSDYVQLCPSCHRMFDNNKIDIFNIINQNT